MSDEDYGGNGSFGDAYIAENEGCGNRPRIGGGVS